MELDSVLGSIFKNNFFKLSACFPGTSVEYNEIFQGFLQPVSREQILQQEIPCGIIT